MLRGEKVILRAFERSDLRRMYDLDQQYPELVILARGGWQPIPFESFEKHWEKQLTDEEQTWFVIEVDGKAVGGIGLHHLNRRASTTEFGVFFNDPDYLGKGYGRDAIRVLLRWAFLVEGWRKVSLTTGASNERALRSYKACGFVEEGRLREQAFNNGQYEDIVVMSLLRREWDALQQPPP